MANLRPAGILVFSVGDTYICSPSRIMRAKFKSLKSVPVRELPAALMASITRESPGRA
ncbi:unannotated protein [freshwater metagenome]|uniref:Unannotated protein n=1 Tax=freshwater metagenome TaxID=449393 RepID=A0A6J6HHY5_9ZZZZ